jgi:hypothetical protein
MREIGESQHATRDFRGSLGQRLGAAARLQLGTTTAKTSWRSSVKRGDPMASAAASAPILGCAGWLALCSLLHSPCEPECAARVVYDRAIVLVNWSGEGTRAQAERGVGGRCSWFTFACLALRACSPCR